LKINPPQVSIGIDVWKREPATGTTCYVGLQEGEVIRIARKQWKILHFAGIHHPPVICFAGIGDVTIRRHYYSFINISGLQIQIDRSDLSGCQSYASRTCFLKLVASAVMR
jgi:hypothetical protein